MINMNNFEQKKEENETNQSKQCSNAAIPSTHIAIWDEIAQNLAAYTEIPGRFLLLLKVPWFNFFFRFFVSYVTARLLFNVIFNGDNNTFSWKEERQQKIKRFDTKMHSNSS